MSLPEEPLPLRFLGDQTHIQIAYGSKLIAICRRMEWGLGFTTLGHDGISALLRAPADCPLLGVQSDIIHRFGHKPRASIRLVTDPVWSTKWVRRFFACSSF